MILSAKERLEIFARYLGKHIWIENLTVTKDVRELRHQCGLLRGIKEFALLITTADKSVWMPFGGEFDDLYCYKLLLHPLSRLTEDIMATANTLPATGFISQYYVKLGFDMPVFIAPDHPENCKTVEELGLADYRSPRDVMELNYIENGENRQTFINL